jgi:hypothetical protein
MGFLFKAFRVLGLSPTLGCQQNSLDALSGVKLIFSSFKK